MLSGFSYSVPSFIRPKLFRLLDLSYTSTSLFDRYTFFFFFFSLFLIGIILVLFIVYKQDTEHALGNPNTVENLIFMWFRIVFIFYMKRLRRVFTNGKG